MKIALETVVSKILIVIGRKQYRFEVEIALTVPFVNTKAISHKSTLQTLQFHLRATSCSQPARATGRVGVLQRHRRLCGRGIKRHAMSGSLRANIWWNVRRSEDLQDVSSSVNLRLSAFLRKLFSYTRAEPFTSLSVNVRNHSNLPDSLQDYVNGDSLTGDNQYKCELCNERVSWPFTTAKSSLSPLLLHNYAHITPSRRSTLSNVSASSACPLF